MFIHQIMWQRQDITGLELFTLSKNEKWMLTGNILMKSGSDPCKIDYSIEVDTDWYPQTFHATKIVKDNTMTLDLKYTGQGWLVNDVESFPATIRDLDFNATPATNLIPINRLDFDKDPQPFECLWIDFDDLNVTISNQMYERLSPREYRYINRDSGYTVEIEVDQHNCVVNYPEYWKQLD